MKIYINFFLLISLVCIGNQFVTMVTKINETNIPKFGLEILVIAGLSQIQICPSILKF